MSGMQSFRRQDAPENPDADEKKALAELQELINKGPVYAQALLIQANLRVATALEDLVDLLEDRFAKDPK